MQTGKIKTMIQEAITDEKRTGRLGKMIKENAHKRGLKPTNQEVQGVVSLVQEYVTHVPLLLNEGAKAAQSVGLDAEMKQMLQELQSYWFETNDLIPDNLGLAGLMDDAYATLLLLQALSDYCQATFERPLLPQNLTAANQGMRVLIGDPLVSVIEQRVGITMANAMMQRILGQISTAGLTFGSGPDPIWGNASIDEIVRARLGAMGVV